jgi:hypothetical protein
MLFSAMETHDTIEMCVINRHLNDFYQSKIDTNKFTTTTGVLGEDLSYENSPINILKQQTINTSYPNLHDQSKHLNNITIRNLSGSVPALSTGLIDILVFFHMIIIFLLYIKVLLLLRKIFVQQNLF